MWGTSSSEPSEAEDGDQGEFVLRERLVTVDGVVTQYLEAGAGPPLLLLHGHEQLSLIHI